MNLREEQEKVQRSMNTTLSGLQEDPWLTQRVLADTKGEEPVVRKISASAIIVIALVIISITAALAAGLGLFGELAQDPRGDSRLSEVDKAADPLGLEWTTEDGITVRIEQAYYEGNRSVCFYTG
jgi:hypothetical protein